MTIRTRLFSLLMAVIMVISLMPMSVLAADEHVHDEEALATTVEEAVAAPSAEDAPEAAVCTCESDDPASHAPFCALYTAPEAPVCFCVEQCAEGSVNQWCDVCYFDHAACAASGEEEAVVYAGTIKIVPSYDPNLIKSLFKPYFGPDFTMICESQSMELCVGQVGTLPVTFDWGPNYNAYYKSPNDYVWPNGYLGEGAAELVADEYPWEFRGLRAGQKRAFMEVRVGETLDVYQFPDIIITVYDHSYANGFCTRCGGYEPAKLVDGYYQIGNGGQMFWFANHINNVDRTASAKLTADINLENRAWTRIGSTGEGNNNFRGHFDGQGHTIEGLKVTAKNAGGGFFGEVRLGTVENFTIKGTVTVAAKDVTYVGGVIGSAPGANSNQPDHNGATIRNITSYVNVTVNDGLTGVGRIGGFMGYANHETLIENCAWYGTIDLGNQTMDLGAGGFIGRINESSAVTIRNCGAYGNIVNDSVTTNVGAFMGYTAKNSNTVIENCLFAGSVSGSKASSVTPFGTWSGASKTLKNSYYINTLQTTDADAVKVTAAQLASGEVAYKLGSAWGQTIDTNKYPILGGAKVNYGYASCGDNAGKVYTNGQVTDTKPAHNWTEKNGVCTVCGKKCTVHSYTNGTCTLCGYACPKHSFVDSKCTLCGYVCTNHSFENSKCTVCAYECTVHSYENGECTVCGTVCAHIFENYICTVCGYKCIEHSWGEWETVPMHAMVGGGPSPENHKHSCAICGLEEKAPHTFAYVVAGWGDSHRKVCTECPYKDEETRRCSGGTATCTEKAICQYCGASYGELNSHNYDNGFCTACGANMPAELVDGYYEIGNAGQLYWFAEQVNAGQTTINGKLTNNIVINENVLKADGTLNSGSRRLWYPIGSASTRYEGTFDGRNHTVSGLYHNLSTTGRGLFGYISAGGTVQNVGVIDSYIRGSSPGGVAADNAGTIINCYFMGSFSGYGIGGVVGENSGTITNCYSSVWVGANVSYGGVAYSNTGTVTNCYYNSTLYSGNAFYNNTGTAKKVEGKTTGQFNRGEVAYLLGDAFGQTIGSEAYPVLGGAKVYHADTYCGDNVVWGYTNTETPAHNWSNSVCTVCSKACAHAYEDGVCTECGKVCVHEYKNGYCTICRKVCEHDYVDGICTVCGTACIHQFKSSKCTICGYECTEHVYSYHDGWCDFCDYICTEHNYVEGFCTVCDAYEPAESVNGYYEISNAGKLYWFAKEVNGGQHSINGKLTDDIVVNKNVLNADGTLNGDGSNFRPWTTIGNQIVSYVGNFDGNGNTVSGLYFNNTERNNVGLFGFVHGGTIKNVGIVDSYFRGNDNVGGVAGFSSVGPYTPDTFITNCYNTGTVIGNTRVGGVVGGNYNPGATITNCYNTGVVSGNELVGGVIGTNSAIVTDCYYNSELYNGNAIGENYTSGTVTNVEGKTTVQFESGEVAYLLQGEQTEQVWGQNVDGEGTKDAYPVLGGAKVYYGYDSCAENAVKVYSNAQVSDTKPSHSYTNGVCTVCGTAAPFAFFGSNVTLGNELNLNFAVEQKLVPDGAYAIITRSYSDGKSPVTSDKIYVKDWDSTSSPGLYLITYKGLAAKEMGDEVIATVYDKDGKELGTRKDSIQSYAMRTMGNLVSIINAKTLLIKMLDYGAAAQVEFGYDAENLVNAEITEAMRNDYPFRSKAVTNSGTPKDDVYMGTSLVLENRIEMQMGFVGDPTGVTARVTYKHHDDTSDVDVTITADKFYKYTDENGNVVAYGVIIPYIMVADARQDVTVTLTFADETTKTVTDSIESYVARNNSEGIYGAIMDFSDAAYAYLH